MFLARNTLELHLINCNISRTTFSLPKIEKFRFFLNIFKSVRKISFKGLSSNYICTSAFYLSSFFRNKFHGSRIIQENLQNFARNAIVRVDLEISPVVARINKRYICVSRTTYSRNALFLLKYLMIYDFHSRRTENFDIF